MMEHEDSDGFEAEGRRLLAQGQADKALAAFRAGLTRFPGDKDLLLGSGLAHLEMGDYVQGCELLEPLAARYPGWAEAVEALVEARLRMGRKAQALEAIESALACPETSGESLHLLGYLLFFHGQYAEASRCYEAALARDAACAPAALGLAACRHRLGRVDEAVLLLEALVHERVPAYWEAYSFLGNLLIEKGRVREGLALLEKIPAEHLWDPTTVRRLMDSCRKGTSRRKALERRLRLLNKEAAGGDTPSRLLEAAGRRLSPEGMRPGRSVPRPRAKGKSAGIPPGLKAAALAIFGKSRASAPGIKPLILRFDKGLCGEFLSSFAAYLRGRPARPALSLLQCAVEVVREMRRRFQGGMIDEEILRRLRAAAAERKTRSRPGRTLGALTSLLSALDAPWKP